jgi:MFS family permease
LLLSAFVVRETRHHVQKELAAHRASAPATTFTQGEIFRRSTWADPDLSSVSQAGLVNNLNDGMAWGLFPLVFAATGLSLADVGVLAAVYPAVWGVAQIFTGALSDRVGRKWLIVWGMWVQAVGIAVTAVAKGYGGFGAGAVLLGLGTAMVYPTLLAAIGDVAHPSWRASAVGVYRWWRDLGYAIGALLAGFTADQFGLAAAVWLVAGLTFGSGCIAGLRMKETLTRTKP